MAHPREILNTLGANARKSLSQNFLTSPHWATLLVAQTLEGTYDEVWEIGPGLGALTELLVKNSKKPLRLFEYDRKLSAYLRQRFPSVTLIEGDVLDADLKTMAGNSKIALLSNLPYHLSSPILFKLIEMKENLSHLVLTFQREFAERLIAAPRTSDYGALSVLAQLHFKIESLGVLPAGAFFPPPAIASEALRLTPRNSLENLDFVAKVVKGAFLHRRKKMRSNLKEVFPTLNWPQIELPHAETARAEELSKEDYVELSKILLKFQR